jgi:hypothetical protein
VDGLNVVEAAAAQPDDGDADAIVRAEYLLGLKCGYHGGAGFQKISTVDID